MSRIYSTAKLLLLAILFSFIFPISSAQADTTDNSYKVSSQAFLRGTYVQVGIGANGHFGTTVAPPTSDANGAITWRGGLSRPRTGLGFIADRNRDNTWLDGDFFMPGSPYEGWYLDAGGTTGKFDNGTTSGGTSASFGDVTISSSAMSVTYTDTINGVQIEQTYSVPIGTGTFTGDQQLNISVKLTNTSGTDKTGVYYARSVDPDNRVDSGGSFSTQNKIESQYGSGGNLYSLVSAQSGGSYLGLFSADSRSKVSREAGGFGTPTTAASLFSGSKITSTSDAGALVDGGISLGVNVGTMAAGATTTFTFAYVLSSTSAASAIAAAAAPAPAAPTVIANSESATVSWSAPTSADPITGYSIRYTETPTASPVVWTTINFYGDTSTSHAITNPTTNGQSSVLVNGHTYYFEVAAVTGDPSSEVLGTWSDMASGILPGGPTTPVVLSSSITGETATVTFTPADTTDPSKPITTYDYSIDGGTTWITIDPAVTTSPIEIPGITAGSSFPVKIRARNDWGAGPSASVGTLYGDPLWTDSTLGTISAGSSFTDGVAAGAGITSYAVSSGSLPPGLTLNTTTGAITGTPTSTGSYSFTITATNPRGSISTTFTKTVDVTPGAPTWNISSLGTVTKGSTFSLAGGATGATSYAILSGSLPAGLTLNTSTGAITGSPTTEGAYTVVIKAINGSGYTPFEFTGTVTAASSGRRYIEPTPTPSTEPTSTNTDLPVINYGDNKTPIQPIIGSPLTLINNQPVANTLVPVNGNALTLTTQVGGAGSEPIVLNIQAKESNGSINNLASNSALTFTPGGLSNVSGTGFLANTVVKAWIFSNPQFLGDVSVDGAGNFDAGLFIPKNLSVGKHIIQFNGTAYNGQIISASIVVIVKAKDAGIVVVPFDYNSYQIAQASLTKILKTKLGSVKSVKVLGYASDDKTNDDMRLSLFRAITIKSLIEKNLRGVKVTAAGKGAARNTYCANYKNLCAVIVAA